MSNPCNSYNFCTKAIVVCYCFIISVGKLINISDKPEMFVRYNKVNTR